MALDSPIGSETLSKQPTAERKLAAESKVSNAAVCARLNNPKHFANYENSPPNTYLSVHSIFRR